MIILLIVIFPVFKGICSLILMNLFLKFIEERWTKGQSNFANERTNLLNFRSVCFRPTWEVYRFLEISIAITYVNSELLQIATITIMINTPSWSIDIALCSSNTNSKLKSENILYWYSRSALRKTSSFADTPTSRYFRLNTCVIGPKPI